MVTPEICPHPDLLCTECPVKMNCQGSLGEHDRVEIVKKVYKYVKAPEGMSRAVARALGLI